MNLIKLAKSYTHKGFSVIPVTVNKQPALRNWSKFQVVPMDDNEIETHFKSAAGIGLLCGGSARVFCLDIDLKYDLTGDVFKRFKRKVPKEILEKLYVQKTKNNGFHLAAIVPSTRLFGNEKFAMRYTTPEEKHKTYLDYYYDPKTRPNAMKIALKDDRRVIFESRSGTPQKAGGYFILPPSPGYKKLYGKFNEITEDEYDVLVEAARSFNEVLTKDRFTKSSHHKDWEVDPFEDFNENHDVVSLLLSYGWSVIGGMDRRYVRLKRPGKSHSKDSAVFDNNTKVFNVFSTSTIFEVGKGYTPTGIFITLECNDDEKEAFKKIMNLGYGKQKN